MLSRIENKHDFLNRIIFSDEATFHVSNKVHSCIIWDSENPHAVQEVKKNSPNFNVWCALSHDTVIGPFFFAETSFMANIYPDMLQIYAIPQMQHLQPTVIFQQDGAPPYWRTYARAFLDATFPNQWIRHGGPIALSPRSSDVTPLDFIFWRQRQSFLKIFNPLRTTVKLACENKGIRSAGWDVYECSSPFPVNIQRVCKIRSGNQGVFKSPARDAVSELQVLGFGAGEFQVRNPIPPKVRVYVGLFQAKSHVMGETSSCLCGVEFWRGDASSGVVLVI
ncbi:hypothetical protein AVEN_118720-1 [Araneus ventricosus]|uniref:Tc1-like transposase DDE domain-containing protein n=1 Tax=Araneus ventricosus TaxID=182803 RepID=A0A4Y2BXX9_ARAVE|nr:hypothetical protein AVEN_118720-1 [Araneus ventricosus]